MILVEPIELVKEEDGGKHFGIDREFVCASCVGAVSVLYGILSDMGRVDLY